MWSLFDNFLPVRPSTTLVRWLSSVGVRNEQINLINYITKNFSIMITRKLKRKLNPKKNVKLGKPSKSKNKKVSKCNSLFFFNLLIEGRFQGRGGSGGLRTKLWKYFQLFKGKNHFFFKYAPNGLKHPSQIQDIENSIPFFFNETFP